MHPDGRVETDRAVDSTGAVPSRSRRRRLSRTEGLVDLSWRDWCAVFGRVILDMGDDATPLLSAGVAFYMFLSVFPGLLVAFSVYGLVADPGQVEEQVASVLAALPGDARGVLANRLHALTTASQSGWSIHLLLAVLGALWTSSLGVTGLLKAVKIAYDEEEHRNFLQLRWTGVLLTGGAIVFLVVSIGLLAVVPVLLDSVGLAGAQRTFVQLLRWAAVVVLALVALTAVYHLGAGRTDSDLKWTAPGTVVAATVWTGMNAIFTWYVASIGNYSATYGGITGGVVLLLWLFLTNLVILFGAEVNAEAERQVRGQVRHRQKEAPWVTAATWWRTRHQRRPGGISR
jgi:membrane protein